MNRRGRPRQPVKTACREASPTGWRHCFEQLCSRHRQRVTSSAGYVQPTVYAQFSTKPAPLPASGPPAGIACFRRSHAMSTCPILTDLHEAAADLKAALRRIRKDFEFCSRCPANPCSGRLRFNDLISQAASEIIQELRNAPGK
ncbi:MAG: hypothetical protein IT308_07030 [Anaerolineaceae bacterium]|nr:hypothetical protein [Anaerolineaceae bacterium]